MVAVRTPMRRFDPRVEVIGSPVSGELQYEGARIPVFIEDVSDGGVKLALSRRLKPGIHVHLLVALAEGEVALEATVRWCEARPDQEPYAAGLQIAGAAAVLATLQRLLGGYHKE